jgi:WD40 repeat protein
MKKTLFLTALVCAALGAVSAQQETPMFFTADADVKAGIGSARYSPDGRNIAVEHKGTILFYDAANGRELRRFLKQEARLPDSDLKILYSPNGRQIATYFWYSNAIKILNAGTGQLERTIPWPDSNTYPLAYSPDGTRIAARSGDIIRIWNTANGNETGTLPASDIPYMGSSNIMYHPNGKRLLAASAYGFTIYNVDTRQALKSIAADEESDFGTVTYSPDGNCIVALYGAMSNRKVKIFDAETRQELRTITAEGSFSSAVYSPDRKHLLVRYRDNNRNYIVKILDAGTGRELRTLTTQDYMFSWSPDGRRIISVPGSVYEGNDLLLAGSWATVWDASSGQKLLTIGYSPLNAGARAYADMQVARFLGDTAAVGRHEGIIRFITDRGNVFRAEVEAFYRQNIGTLVTQTVDAEFRDITIAASRKTSIKQGLTAFFVNPNQTTYNGLKLYKYPNGTDHSFEIRVQESNIVGDLHNAETFDRQGMKGAAQAARDAANAGQELLATLRAAEITTIRALNVNLADRILRDSR